MSDWRDLAHFMYGRGFWYADPLKEIEGLTEEQLYWVPDPNSFCILWHVGHIAHRERVHLGIIIQGLTGDIIPPQSDVFGTDWCTPEEVRRSVESVEQVLSWVRDVREESHEYIASLADEDLFRLVPTSEDELTVGHWLFITTAHTALHLGRIQLLRALVEGKHDRAC